MDSTITPRETKRPLFYILAVIFGLACGVLHVVIHDPLLTSLGVLSSSMILGVARPLSPWRWTLLVGIPVPLVLAAATLSNYYDDITRSTVAGSILIILPGFAGAYGGSFMRGFINNVFLEGK